MITWYHKTKQAPDFDKRIARCEEDGTWAYMDEIEKADTELEKLKAKKARTPHGKRDVVDELIKHELVKVDEIVNVLEFLGIVPLPPKGYLSESDGWWWFEANPPREEKLRVLEGLNYDVSGL